MSPPRIFSCSPSLSWESPTPCTLPPQIRAILLQWFEHFPPWLEPFERLHLCLHDVSAQAFMQKTSLYIYSMLLAFVGFYRSTASLAKYRVQSSLQLPSWCVCFIGGDGREANSSLALVDCISKESMRGMTWAVVLLWALQCYASVVTAVAGLFEKITKLMLRLFCPCWWRKQKPLPWDEAKDTC